MSTCQRTYKRFPPNISACISVITKWCVRLRVSVSSVIIHSETVLYSWQNNGKLVTHHCKQSNKANLLGKGYWNMWLSSRLIIQEHIVEYVKRTLLKLLLKSFNISTIVKLKFFFIQNFICHKLTMVNNFCLKELKC